MDLGDPADSTVIVTRARMQTSGGAPDGDRRSYVAVMTDDEVIAWRPIGPDPLTVGRDAGRDIVLDDGQVSRLHLQLMSLNGRLVVQDLGSSNGTFLDGQRLQGPVVLEEGRRVQVGSHLLVHERRTEREVARAEEQRRDLVKARGYVRALLPDPVRQGPVHTDWMYKPCAQLGGDAFSYGPLDGEHLVAYVLDVSGHGVTAAMHSVSVLNVLRQRALPDTDFRDPARVLAALNAMFPMEAHDGMYFTLWYGVYAPGSRELRYASAGHHAAFLYGPGGRRDELRTPGPMIGALDDYPYQAATCIVPERAALYLFSDGAFEITTADGQQADLREFLPLLEGIDAAPEGEAERIYRAVRARARPGPLDDDFTLLVARFH